MLHNRPINYYVLNEMTCNDKQQKKILNLKHKYVRSANIANFV